MRAVIIALLGACLATGLAPPVGSEESSSTPWTEGIVRVAGLGRTRATADIVWMRMVQLIGSPRMEQAGYPDLDGWLDLTSRLDPTFLVPYFFGAILLVTDDARAARVDGILARGEAAAPDVFSLPMYRGFLAYFGRLDRAAAAAHYGRAANKPNAPPYLGPFSERLRRDEGTCANAQRDLQEVASSSDANLGSFLANARGKLLIHCLKARIETAATSWRVKNDNRAPTMEDLFASGLLERPQPAPAGSCWQLDEAQKASLVPCPAEAAP